MTRRRTGFALLVILAAAALLGGPILLLGAPATDSGYYNRNWAEHFAALVARGVLPPRWVPDAFGGLGSPTFVFYAPLPFLVAAPFLWIGGGVIDANHLVGIAQVAMLVGSGLAMCGWLRPRVGEQSALVGAILYMAAPYHLFDLYVRGSIGEIAAYAVLPLFMTMLDRTLRAGVGQAPWLAATTALLMLCHLPTALLVAVFLAAPSAAFATLQDGRPLRFRMRHGAVAIAAGVAGLALAAFYWVPAITMMAANAFDLMAQGRYDARRWLLIDPEAWVAGAYMAFVAAASLAAVAMALAPLTVLRRPGGRRRTEALFWSGLTLIGLAVMAGVVPTLWGPASPLSRVQFPWRMLIILEFAAVTCLCIGMARPGRMPHAGVLVALLVACVPAFFVLAAAAWPTQSAVTGVAWRQTQRDLDLLRPDPGEYLPAGHWLAGIASGTVDIGHVRQIMASVGRSDPAWWEPADGVFVLATPRSGGGLRLAVSAPQGGLVVIRRFHFPAWTLASRVGDVELRGEPHGPNRLLSFRVPPGEHEFEVVWRSPPVERLASIASGLGWLLWLGAVLVCRRRGPGGIGGTTHPT